MPLRAIITEATTADCRQAIPLIEGMKAEQLLAEKAHDTNEILQLCEKYNTIPVIPSKSNRQCPRQHDAYLYRQRHLVENAFLWLKRWCGIATRYAKNASSCRAAIHFRCLIMWAEIL